MTNQRHLRTLHFAAPLLMLPLVPGLAAAQHDTHSQYAGGGSAEVKTLTAEEVADLRAAAGMGLARPAELNGYPGPRHVLDLAAPLDLTASQRQAVDAVFRAMQERARSLGVSIIAEEKALDAAFAEGAGPVTLEARVREVARLQGELRWTHLRAHLEIAGLLSLRQRHEYNRLRGYGGHVHEEE